MSTEIATWNMIRSKIPSFPSPTAGRGNECLTKAEIQSLGGESLSIKGSYSNNECVILRDIEKVRWEYFFSATPLSIILNNAGNAQSVTIASYKRKYIENDYTGIQINVPWSSSITSGFSINGTVISASQNNSESKKKGTATFVQSESGKNISVNVEQLEGTPIWVYHFSVSPTSLNFSATGDTQLVSVLSYKDKYIGGFYTGIRLNVGFTSSCSNSWISSTGTSVAVQENTVTSPRTGTVNYTQNESGNLARVEVEQSEAVITKRGNISCTPGSVIFYTDEHTQSYHLTVSSIEITYINGKYASSVPVPWNICKSDGTSCGSYVTIENPNTMITCIKNSDSDVEFYLANVSSNSIGFSSSVNLSQVGSNADTWNVSINIRKRL